MNASENKLRTLRAHFVGAPFFVPDTATSLQERFAATGYNTGNLLIGDAAARLLDVDIVSSGTMVDIRNLKDAIDLLVIPAANFLSPVMDLSWLLPIVEGTNHPILMVGVGAQFPTTRIADAQLPENTLRLMHAISDRCQSISVRGQFTADVLAKFGIKNTHVTGCPSLFTLGREKLSIQIPSPDDFKPAFNGSSNVLKHASSADEARKAELKVLRLAMESAAPYVLQNELPEMQIAARDRKGAEGCKTTLHNLGADITLDRYLKYIMEHAKTFFRADRWAEFIARHDIVIGTRFHGNIIALSQGIPAAFVAHDSRTIELCEALLIPFVGLKQFADTDLRQIVEQLDFSKMEKHFPAARRNLASFFEENQVPHRLQADAENEGKKAAQSIAARFVQVQDAENEDAEASLMIPSAGAERENPVEQLKGFLSKRQLELAIQAYEGIASSHPKYVGATLLLAESLITGYPEKAFLLAQGLIASDRRNAKSYWIAVRALRQMNRMDEARKIAELGLERGEDGTWLAELDKFLIQDEPSPLADLGDEIPARKFVSATADEVSFGIHKAYAAIFPLDHGASSDEAAYVPPAKTCLIAMLPRSGSNMLCGMLEQTRVLGYPGEYLSPRGPMQLYRDRYKSRNFLEYMNSVVSSRRTPNGIFALKTAYGDFNPIESSGLAGSFFPNAKFIYLIRKNIVAQAISAQKAKTSGLWHKRANGSPMGSAKTAIPQYDKASILNIVRGLVRDQQDWELFFLLHKINPLRITYEELCENPYRVLEDVISFLGVEPAVSLKSITVPTMRLADDTNREWEERFLGEFSL